MKYTMTMTAYQLAGSGTEIYQQVDVTTLEGCMYFFFWCENTYISISINLLNN